MAVCYETWEHLWREGYRSARFFAPYGADDPQNDRPLSERLLFTQSNLRVLLGQNPSGQLAFVCAPHEQDYALPTCVTDAGSAISAHPGMYYQTDVAMLLGNLRYTLEIEGAPARETANGDSRTVYLDHFLPTTETVFPDCEARVFSLAPVLEPRAAGALAPLPLPGPSGCLFCLHLKNTSARPLEGRCRLDLDGRFVIRSEFDGKHFFEEDAVPPYRCEWERDLYTLWRPDACASLQLEGAVHNRDAEHPQIHVPFLLAPDEERLFTCRIAVAPDKSGIAPALCMLYQHDALQWLNITAAFWRDRLGDWTARIAGEEDLARDYRDMQLRNILDDFNCLQTDLAGRLLVHWQGAPSHNVGRFWGIDIEPTGLSLLYALPELGPVLLRYLSTRYEPRYSDYDDHSTPIRIALLVLAGKYLALTGDADFFRRDAAVTAALHAVYERLMASRHKTCCLFSSRYSSDGIVFHRYDLGTNAKAYFALRGYQAVLRALGDARAAALDAFLSNMQRDIRAVMSGEGPFGPQFTGGNSLGEGKDFYFKDALWYYDGEDSSSCMIPVYGVFDYNDPAWINYHRFARSLFCSNFDPEMEALRWFFYGGAVDGTAYVSRMGGSLTRAEMRDALRNMLAFAVDLTGSLYWWPRGVDKRRCIARCSQGQGSWVLQGTEQWLGLSMDATRRTLTVCPRGLLSGYRYTGLRLGNFRFDVEYDESGSGAVLRVCNRNQCAVLLHAGARAQGAGASGPIDWKPDCSLAPGETATLEWSSLPAANSQSVSVEAVEAHVLAREGRVFGPFGMELPCTEQPESFLLRYVLINATEKPFTHVRLKLSAQSGWGVAAKTRAHWTPPKTIEAQQTILDLDVLPPLERAVLPFYVRPADGIDAKSAWLNAHPFAFPAMPGSDALFLCLASNAPGETLLTAELSYTDGEGRAVVCAQPLPVRLLSTSDHADWVRGLLYE